MQVRNLYRYETNIGVVITPDAREETDRPHGVRIIAEEGMAITNGTDTVSCVDVSQEDIPRWSDCALPDEAFDPETSGRVYTETDQLIDQTEGGEIE